MPSPGFDPFEGEEDEYDPDDEEPIPDDEIDEPPDEEDPYDSMNEMNEKYEGEISMAMMEENIEKAKLDEAKMTVSNIDPKDIPNVTVASITAAFDAMKAHGQEKAHILEQIIKAQTGHTMSRAEAYAFIQKLVVSEGEPGWAMYVGYLKGSRFLQNQSKETGKIDPYCFACGGFGMPKPVNVVPPIVVPAPCTKCYDHMLGDDVFASLKDIETITGKPLMGVKLPEKAEGLKANMIIVDEMEEYKAHENDLLMGDEEQTASAPPGIEQFCAITYGVKYASLKDNMQKLVEKEYLKAEQTIQELNKKLKPKADCVDLGKKHKWVNHTLGGHVCSVCEKLTTIAQMQESMVVKEALKQTIKETYPTAEPPTPEQLDSMVKSYEGFPQQLQQSPPTICVEFGTKHDFTTHPTLKNTCLCGNHKPKSEFTNDGYCNVCMGTDWKHSVAGCKGTFTSYEDADVKTCPVFGEKHQLKVYDDGKYHCACGVTTKIAKQDKGIPPKIVVNPHCTFYDDHEHNWFDDMSGILRCKCGVGKPKGMGSEEDVKLIDAKCPSYHPNGPKHKWEIQTLAVARCANCKQAVTSAQFVGELSIQNPIAMEKWIQLDKDKKQWQMESECVNHVQLKHDWYTKDATTIRCANCNMEIEGSELVNKLLKETIDKPETLPEDWIVEPCPHYPQKKHNWEIQNLTRVWCVQCSETRDGVSVVEELVASHFKHAKKYAALVKAAQLKGQPTLKAVLKLELGGGLMDSMKKIKYGDPCPGTESSDHHWQLHPASDQHIQCAVCKFEVLAPEIAAKFKPYPKPGQIPTVEVPKYSALGKLLTKGKVAYSVQEKSFTTPLAKKMFGTDPLEAAKKMADALAKKTEEAVLGLQDTTSHEEIPYTKVASAHSETGTFEYQSTGWHIYRVSPEIVEVSSKKPGQEHTGFARYFKLPKDWRIKSVTATRGSVGQLKGMGIKITEGTEIMSLVGTSLSDAAGIVNPVYCSACNGWGKDLQDPNKPAKDCSVCKGTSIVENTGGLVGIDYKCGVCDGFGKIATWNADGVVEQTTPCAYCKGTGKAVTPSTYSSGLKEAFKEKKMVAEWGGDPDVDVSDAPGKEPELKYQKMVASEFIGAGSPVYLKDDGSIAGLKGQGDEAVDGDLVKHVFGYAMKGALQGDTCEVNVVAPHLIPSFTEEQIDAIVAQMKGWEQHEPCGCLDDNVNSCFARLKDARVYAIHPSVPGGVSSHAAIHIDHLSHHLFGHNGIFATQGPPMEVKLFKTGHDIEQHMLVSFLDGQMGKTYGQARRYETGDDPMNLMGYAMHTAKKGQMVAVSMMKIPYETQKAFEGEVATAEQIKEMVNKSKLNINHYYPKATCYFHGQRIQFTNVSVKALKGNKGGFTAVKLEGFTQPEKGIHTFATKDLIMAAGLYPETFLVDDREFIVDEVHPSVEGINTKEQYAVIIEGHLAPLKGEAMSGDKQKYLHELEAYCKATYNVEYSALNEKNKKVCAEQFEKDEKKFPGEPTDDEMEKFCWATYGELFHKMNPQKQALMKIEYAQTEHKYAIPQGQKPGKSLDDLSIKVGPVRIKGGKFEHLQDLDGWHHEKEGVCLKHDGKVVMRIRGDGKVILDEDQHFMHDMSTPLAKEFIQAFWTGVGSNNPFLKRYSDALDEMGKQEKELAKLYKIIGHFALRDERIKQRTEGDPMVARFRNIAAHMEGESSG